MTHLLLGAAATRYFFNTKLVEDLVEEYFYIVLAAGESSTAHKWLGERCTQAINHKEIPQDFLKDNDSLIASYHLKDEDADVPELLIEVVMRLVRIKTSSRLEALGSGASFYANIAGRLA
jgi:hypothetical protein